MSISNEMLNQMSMSELRSLNERVIQTIKYKRKMEAMNVKSQLYVGALVESDHKQLVGQTYEVVKINRTKADIRSTDGYGFYTVPMNLLNVVETV